MANNKQDSLYNPDRKPDSNIAKPSVDVNSNTSADSAITPGATEGETLEQAIARVATLREKRSEWEPSHKSLHCRNVRAIIGTGLMT